jgi:Divergent InlB B-repeat domain
VFEVGRRVVLRAKSTRGSRFKRWSGACRGTRVCVVRMNSGRAVRAQFVRKR